ncbi:MAG: CotS family spore coat protein [Clostridia bacterium]|nr:CotS family spore coat protein [Clostridia bacterium]
MEREIAENYNLEIKNIVHFRDGYIINTASGKKYLKKSLLSNERILFVHSVKEHLYNKGFIHLDRYLCTREGLPYITMDQNNYIITDVIEGSECNFDKLEDVVNASKALASLHKSSREYVLSEDCKPRDDLGLLPEFLQKRLDEIKKLKKVAKKGKSKFDYMFLDYIDYFYNLGYNAIGMLMQSKYNDIVEETRKEGMFCHHDYAHHNIICSGSKVTVINFDYCCFEIKVYDVANLLRRKMRKCNWDLSQAKIILDHYREIEKISDDEFLILKIILMFPQKFWRIVNKYYNSKRSWSERSYISKLQEAINEIENHKKFIEELDSLA